MAKGDIVLIRASRGEPGVRRIWDDSGGDPFVCLEVYWGRWETDGVTPVCWPVGKDQLFAMDEELVPQLEAAFESAAGDSGHLDSLWSRAKPYQG